MEREHHKEPERKTGLYIPLTETDQVIEKLTAHVEKKTGEITLRDMFESAADIAISQFGKQGSAVYEVEGEDPFIRFTLGEKFHEVIDIPFTLWYRPLANQRQYQESGISFDHFLADFDGLGPSSQHHSHTYKYIPQTGYVFGDYFHSERYWESYPVKPDQSLLAWALKLLKHRERR